jgi:hypothetical protein
MTSMQLPSFNLQRKPSAWFGQPGFAGGQRVAIGVEPEAQAQAKSRPRL